MAIATEVYLAGQEQTGSALEHGTREAGLPTESIYQRRRRPIPEVSAGAREVELQVSSGSPDIDLQAESRYEPPSLQGSQAKTERIPPTNLDNAVSQGIPVPDLGFLPKTDTAGSEVIQVNPASTENPKPEAEPEIQLSVAQKAVAQALLRDIETEEGVVVLEGLRGVGKSTVLERIQAEIEDQGGQTMEAGYFVVAFTDKDEPGVVPGKLIISGTPREYELVVGLLREHYPTMERRERVLRGMDQQETRTYLQGLRQKGKVPPCLTDEQLIRLSMGVPLLAQELMATPDITFDIAQKIASSYLAENLVRTGRFAFDFQAGIGHYLLVEPLPEVVAAAGEYDPFSWRHVYDGLESILQRSIELERQGVVEESPLFVAQKSVEIYNRMLALGREGWPRINIFVPELGPDDLARLTAALGMKREWAFYPEEKQAVRVKMFGGSLNKVQLWLRDLDERTYSWPGPEVGRRAIEAEKRFLRGDFPIEQRLTGVFGRFFLQATEHLGLMNNPALIGWTLESLLQQRGVSYIADNEAADLKYAYHPEGQKIEIF